jgi:hypothetical protein
MRDARDGLRSLSRHHALLGPRLPRDVFRLDVWVVFAAHRVPRDDAAAAEFGFEEAGVLVVEMGTGVEGLGGGGGGCRRDRDNETQR